jgi:hypothetical protein
VVDEGEISATSVTCESRDHIPNGQKRYSSRRQQDGESGDALLFPRVYVYVSLVFVAMRKDLIERTRE